MNSKANRVLILLLVTIATVLVATGFRLRGETILPARQTGGAADKIPNYALLKMTSVLTGKWSVEDTTSVLGSQVQAVTSHGTEVWGTNPGGIPFYEEYHSNGPDGEQYLHAIYWWDASQNKLKGIFCARFVTEGCSPFDVDWKNDQFVLTGEYQAGTNTIAWTENFKMSGADAFTQTLSEGMKDHPQQLSSTIHATRIK